MVKINIAYEGNLRCRLTHEPSGDEILTDAPTDNMGQGEAFSPTDLVAAALGSCMLTVMGIAARKNNIPFEHASADVEKEMVADPVRRVGKISVALHLPASLKAEHRQLLENAALNCPVHKSLDHRTETPIRFAYDAKA